MHKFESEITYSFNYLDTLLPKSRLAPVHRPCVKHKEEAKAEKSAKDSR